MGGKPIGIRWNLGDASLRGFEALQLSVWGAFNIFGPSASYAVCVHGVSLDRAQALVGPLPDGVLWLKADEDGIPEFAHRRMTQRFSHLAGWKLSPVRLFPDRHELALENDVILWEMPSVLESWLYDAHPSFLLAEDIRPGLGQFTQFCDEEPLDSSIRGLPPKFDYSRALASVLEAHPVSLMTEMDERGLHVAAIRRAGVVHVARTEEVSLCSPFPPHQPGLGKCGAHFTSLNAHNPRWSFQGRPAVDCIREHWSRMRTEVWQRVAPGLYRPSSERLQPDLRRV